MRPLLQGPKTIHLPDDLTALGGGGKLFEPEAGGEVRQAGVELAPAGWEWTSARVRRRYSAM